MKALLLAAGKATRLGGLSRTTPKCLHQVGGETLLDRLVKQLSAAGVEHFLINAHHLADQIFEHVSNAEWSTQAKVVFESELLGTLGTVRANASFFEGGPGWVLHADNYIAGSLRGLRSAFARRPPHVWGSMLTFIADEPENCGVVQVDANEVVLCFHEKVKSPPTRQASAATFVLDERALDLAFRLPRSAVDISHDLVPKLLGRIQAVPAQAQVVDIGTPLGLERARCLASMEVRRQGGSDASIVGLRPDG